MDEASATSETIPETSEPTLAEPSETEPPAEAKKRGRPAGAKDRAPRKKRVVIEEEAPAEAPEPPAVHQQQEEQAQEPEPASPTEVLREASKVVRHAQAVRMQARRTNLSEIYSRHLLSLP
jgi:hypothetical protein